MEIMKKAIRIIDGIFALCLIIIYSFIVFGNIVLPDKIEAYSTKKIEYKSVYSVENNSLYQVDYQNNSKVSTRMGNYAVKLLMNNIGNRVVAAQKEDVVDYDIFEALNMKKTIDMNLYDIAHEVSI